MKRAFAWLVVAVLVSALWLYEYGFRGFGLSVAGFAFTYAATRLWRKNDP